MKFQYEPARIYAKAPDGTLLAEITFPLKDGAANIDHTFVDASLRGQGVASQLVEAAVGQIRADGTKASLTCSYAIKWFKAHPEHADILAGQP